jgi:predicted O-linked N-acetylglucosamine transferase (SPINDLY family)
MDHHGHGRFREAEQIYRAVLAQQPRNADALHLLGILAGQQNTPDQAVDLITKAIAVRPNVAPYHANLAQALATLGRREEAINVLQKAVAIDPNYSPIYYSLGGLLQSLERNEDAIAAYEKAIKFQPNNAQARNNLGIVLRQVGRWDEALAQLEEADRLLPNSANIHTNLAMIYLDTAKHEQAITAYDRALSVDPPTPDRLSSRIAAMHYDPRFTAADILSQARRFDDLFAVSSSPDIPVVGRGGGGTEVDSRVQKSRDPDRKLRIGYVSPDLRNHVVGRCMLPILPLHDRQQFQIYCYASVPKEDDVSAELRQKCDVWKNIDDLDDDSAADLIRADEIDILIDLAVHTEGNRLPLFVRKPAPIQMTWLGYCSTTGLSAINHRISDAFADPTDADLAYYTEKTIRLPGAQFCYPPPHDSPPISPLPAATAGFVTFGCLNNFTKCSGAAIAAWIQILQTVPKSRFILHARPGRHLESLAARFHSAGISDDRVEFVPQLLTARYLQTWSRIDIALDPFPYNGGITSCDALWMGIPVVTILGKTAVGRMGSCVLNNMKFPELVARSIEEYIRLAGEWAADIDRLTRVRTELRARLQNSPLMNPRDLTRNLETAYRQAWQTYCSGGAAS